MFNKLIVSAVAILAVATPAMSQTTSGTACCDSTTTAGAPGIATLLGLLGVVAQGVNVPIGLGCSPITVVGVSGTSCTTDPVSCDQIFSASLVGINCTPINAGL